MIEFKTVDEITIFLNLSFLKGIEEYKTNHYYLLTNTDLKYDINKDTADKLIKSMREIFY